MLSGGGRGTESLPLAPFPWLENIEERFHHAIGNHAYAASRRFGQIGNTSGHERAAIVYHHLHTAMVLEIGDAHARAERQRSVRHGERRRIERLAAGGLPAREIIAVHRNAAVLLRAYRSVARRWRRQGWRNSRCQRRRCRLGRALELRATEQHRASERRDEIR